MTHEPGHTDWLVQSFQKCFSYKKLIMWRRRSTQNIIFVKRKRQIWFESVSFKSSILCSQFCDFQTFEIIFFKRTSHRPFQRTEPVKWKSEIAIAQMRFSSAFSTIECDLAKKSDAFFILLKTAARRRGKLQENLGRFWSKNQRNFLQKIKGQKFLSLSLISCRKAENVDSEIMMACYHHLGDEVINLFLT